MSPPARRRLLALGLGLGLLVLLLAGANAYAAAQGFGGRLVFDDMSPPADVGYRWLPGQHVESPHGFPLDINDYGLRDPREVAMPKPAGAFRVLCLGDSFTFGIEVPWEGIGAQQLESRLRERLAPRPVEAWSAGVNGYNSCQERAWLEVYGWALEPDVVTVGFVMNDALPHAPAPPRDFPGRAWMLRYPLYQWLRHRFVQKGKLEGDDAAVRRRQRMIDQQRGLIETEPSSSALAKECWDEAAGCLAELARSCARRGVPVALMVYPSLPQMERERKQRGSLPEAQRLLGDLAAREGMVFVDLLEAYAAAGEAALLESDKSHPSALGHEIAARELFAALERAGALPQP